VSKARFRKPMRSKKAKRMRSIFLKGFGKREICRMTAKCNAAGNPKGFGKREICRMTAKCNAAGYPTF